MANADWFISVVEKVILLSQQILLDHSCKHCTNKIIKETKLIMPYSDDEEHSPSEFYFPGETNDPIIRV